MDKEKKSKWKWIHLVCMELDLKQSGIIALEIDNHLENLYGRKNTDAWEKRMKNNPPQISRKSVIEIARASAYCIACLESKYKCGLCKFRGEGSILFGKFMMEIKTWEDL